MATFTKFQFNFERGLVISFNPKTCPASYLFKYSSLLLGCYHVDINKVGKDYIELFLGRKMRPIVFSNNPKKEAKQLIAWLKNA